MNNSECAANVQRNFILNFSLFKLHYFAKHIQNLPHNRSSLRLK